MTHFRAILIFVGILLIALFIRIQGIDTLPAGQFTEPDAYLYYWQAQIISEQGHLPARDMHRWLPLGRDLGQTLNFYSYALAYGHKALSFIFFNISLYQVTLYAPVVCFCIGLGALCLFLHRTFGMLFSNSVGVLLATFPGTIERTAAGFSDRDSWCLMLGILSVTTYLTSLQTRHPCQRFFLTLVSGFSVFLGGMSWEGFGVFLGIILVVEMWRFLTSETEDSLLLYFLWTLTFVPPLWLVSPAYQSGYGFATHLFAFMLIPPLGVLCIRALRHLLITKAPLADKLRPHARTLALGLTLASITVTLCYVFTQLNTFDSTTVPFSQNPLMQNVTELEASQFGYWKFRYGGTFIYCCIGVLFTSLDLSKKHRTMLIGAPITLFCLTTFFRQPLDQLWGASLGNIFFFIAITGYIIVLLLIAWRWNASMPNELTYIAFTLWFLVWVALSRDAKRYDLFIGVPLAFFTVEVIQSLSNFLCDKVKQRLSYALLKTSIASALLAGILFFPLLGAHAKRSLFAATQMKKALPGDHSVTRAFQWIKVEIPYTAVVAANWGFGSMLNVLANAKTITDQDHYIQHWIYLYNRYVYHAQSEREILEFLKSHSATHLMLIRNKVVKGSLLRGQLSEAFVPVYPGENFDEADVKIWELHYPADIQSKMIYLKTGFPEIDIDLRP